MSAELAVRVERAFPVLHLLERTRLLTGLGEDLQVLALGPDVIRNDVPPDLAPAAVLAADRPEDWLRLAARGTVADLLWTDTADGRWLTVSATWRTDASTLLATYAAIAAAQLSGSAVHDTDGLLDRPDPVDPAALLAELRQAVPVALAAGAPTSEPYAVTLLRTVSASRGR